MVERITRIIIIILFFTGNSVADLKTGTGFSVADGKHYVTNQHVIEGASSLCLRMSNGEVHPANVVNSDGSDDLAILYSDYVSPPLILAPFGQAQKGLKVITLGFPDPSMMGLESKVTDGIINALSGFQGDLSLIQISSPIQPGNSGGPLISEYGNVVGVVVARFNRSYGENSGFYAENVGYAVNAAKVQGLLETTRNIQLAPRVQLSKSPLSVVDLVSLSEKSVVMILNFSEKTECDGTIPDFPQFSLHASTTNPQSEQGLDKDINKELEEKKHREDERKREAAREKAEKDRLEQQRKKAEADELKKEREKAEAEKLENERKNKSFIDALTSIDSRWKRIYKSPGFKRWTNLDDSELELIFSTPDEIDRATEILSSYKSYVYELYESAELDDVSSSKIYLGGIVLDYLEIGIITKVNHDFGFVVATTSRDIVSSTLIWFYHKQLNDWVSLQVSKVGTGWISASLPENIPAPSIKTQVFIPK